MFKFIFLAIAVMLEAAIIAVIALGAMLGFPAFFLFYNILYGLLLSTCLPLFYIYLRSENLAALGIKKPGIKQIIVIVLFIALSMGGQAYTVIQNDIPVHFELLKTALLPLIMTTFFEELFFRGFMQIRFEKLYGAVPAVILSGLLFSLYHLGYPGFRNLADLLLLFAVGTGFALAFKLAGNSLVAAYCVNLPNALLTYMLNPGKFPPLGTLQANAGASFTIIAIMLIFCAYIYSRQG